MDENLISHALGFLRAREVACFRETCRAARTKKAMWSRLTVWRANLQDAATMCFVGKLQHVSGVNLQLVDLTKFTSATTFWLYETLHDLELLRTAPKLSSLRVTGAGLTLAYCHSVTNEALASLATLKLKRLDLTGVAVGDTGIGPLLSNRLESLSVCSTSVTCDLLTRLPLSLKELKCSAANERVLQHIGKMVNLFFLEIFPVTDSGLAYLATCVNLSELNLSACPITSFDTIACSARNWVVGIFFSGTKNKSVCVCAVLCARFGRHHEKILEGLTTAFLFIHTQLFAGFYKEASSVQSTLYAVSNEMLCDDALASVGVPNVFSAA